MNLPSSERQKECRLGLSISTVALFKKLIGESATIRIDKKQKNAVLVNEDDEQADEFQDDSWLSEYLNRGHEKQLMAFQQLNQA